MAKIKDIILVDDDEIDVKFLSKCLEISSLSNPLLCFQSGQLFLEYMQKVINHSVPMPAVILLDVNMPGMNGFDIVTALREHSKFSSEPLIIFFTTSDSPIDKEKAQSLGIRYVEKFFNRADAIQFLESLDIK